MAHGDRWRNPYRHRGPGGYYGPGWHGGPYHGPGYLMDYGFFGHPGYTYDREAMLNLTDDDIRSRVYGALDDDPFVPETADIRVTVQDRIVTLEGVVRSKNTKRAAGDIAWSAPAVRDVNNNIRIVGRQEAAGG